MGYGNLRINTLTNYLAVCVKEYHKHHHKKSELPVDFIEENNFRNKSKDKPIKKNFVNPKFKIADDFNEENSNKFLNEKDECLREVILSDEIKGEEDTPFFIDDLSPIGKNEYEYNLNSKQFKKKKVKDDSIALLSKLIDDIK